MNLKIDNIKFSYNTSSLIDINELVFQGNSVTNLIGKNGSGKSTLAKILVQIEHVKDIKFYKDDIEVEGDSLNFAMVLQNPDFQFVKSTVAEDLVFGLENLNVDQDKMFSEISEISKKLGIVDLLDMNINDLSGGEKQMVAIASNLILKPDVLILDEAFEMIDILQTKKIIEVIKEYVKKNNIIIINITHDLEIIKEFNYTISLENGKINFIGNTFDLFKDNELLNKLDLEKPFEYELMERLNIDKDIFKKLVCH